MAPGQAFRKERASTLGFMALHSLEMPSHLQSQIGPPEPTGAVGNEALLNPFDWSFRFMFMRSMGNAMMLNHNIYIYIYIYNIYNIYI